jgi:hypothetical protein
VPEVGGVGTGGVGTGALARVALARVALARVNGEKETVQQDNSDRCFVVRLAGRSPASP